MADDIIYIVESTLLYKYQPIKLFDEEGNKIVPNNYLYFNKVWNLNDPFEGIRCHVISEDDKDTDNWNSKLIKAYRNIKSPVTYCLDECESKEFNPNEKDGSHCKKCGENVFDLKNNTAHSRVLRDVYENADLKKVFCLCKNLDSQTMWAHYADNYKGYVIIYDREELIKAISSSGKH